MLGAGTDGFGRTKTAPPLPGPARSARPSDQPTRPRGDQGRWRRRGSRAVRPVRDEPHVPATPDDLDVAGTARPQLAQRRLPGDQHVDRRRSAQRRDHRVDLRRADVTDVPQVRHIQVVDERRARLRPHQELAAGALGGRNQRRQGAGAVLFIGVARHGGRDDEQQRRVAGDRRGNEGGASRCGQHRRHQHRADDAQHDCRHQRRGPARQMQRGRGGGCAQRHEGRDQRVGADTRQAIILRDPVGERRTDKDRQRREARQDVADELGLAEREEDQRNDRCQPQQQGIGRAGVASPVAWRMIAHGGRQEQRPRHERQQQDRHEQDARPRVAEFGAAEAQQVLPEHELVGVRRLPHADRHVPGQSDQREDHEPAHIEEFADAARLARCQQVAADDQHRQRKPRRPLEQRGQCAEEIKAPPGAPPLLRRRVARGAFTNPEARDGGPHRRRERHVHAVPARHEPELRGRRQRQRGNQAGCGAEAAARDEVGGEHRKRCRERRHETAAERGVAAEHLAGGRQPEERGGLVEIRRPQIVRHQPVAGAKHLAHDLRAPRFLLVEHRQRRGAAEEQQRADREQQRDVPADRAVGRGNG